jgi:putative endonuclease
MAGTSPAMTRDVTVVSRDAFNVWIAVYMMASRKHGTIYIGVTSQLPARASQHRKAQGGSFTARYGLERLVWYESHETIVAAIRREKQLKKYKREWKINLIERDNPHWDDLFPTLFGQTDYDRWPDLKP